MYQPTKLPDADPQTKPADPFTLEALAAWLETKPAKKTYIYFIQSDCLLEQYFKHANVPFDLIGGSFYFPSYGASPEQLPKGFPYIAAEHPHTFGAALARTRAEIARRSQQGV